MDMNICPFGSGSLSHLGKWHPGAAIPTIPTISWPNCRNCRIPGFGGGELVLAARSEALRVRPPGEGEDPAAMFHAVHLPPALCLEDTQEFVGAARSE